MKINLYVIYDRVAEISSPIFSAQTEGVALRRVAHLLNEPTTQPEDYGLLHLGTYDDQSVQLEKFIKPVSVDLQKFLEARREAEDSSESNVTPMLNATKEA